MTIKEVLTILEQIYSKTPALLKTERLGLVNFRFLISPLTRRLCLVIDDESRYKTVEDVTADLKTRREDLVLWTDHDYLENESRVELITNVYQDVRNEYTCGLYEDYFPCIETESCKDCIITSIIARRYNNKESLSVLSKYGRLNNEIDLSSGDLKRFSQIQRAVVFE